MKSDNFLRRYTELPFLIDYLHTKQLFLPSPKTWDDRNDSYYIEQYAKNFSFTNTYALCLTEAPETYHHWKVFSSGSSGVCVVFRKDLLLREVAKHDGVRAESVEYKTIDEMRKNMIAKERYPFIKRYPYRDEAEFRLFFATNFGSKNGFRLNMPLEAVDYIHLSPWLPDVVAKEIKTLLKTIKGCSKIKIYRSTLVENENWIKLATKIT